MTRQTGFLPQRASAARRTAVRMVFGDDLVVARGGDAASSRRPFDGGLRAGVHDARRTGRR